VSALNASFASGRVELTIPFSRKFGTTCQIFVKKTENVSCCRRRIGASFDQTPGLYVHRVTRISERSLMERITIWFGGILIAFGLVSYIGTGSNDPTALTPLLPGIPILLLGIAARQGWQPTLALRLAVGLSALALLATLWGLLSGLLPGGKSISLLANVLQALLALGCAIFVGLYARQVLQGRSSSGS
jgi:hypothetical protein